MHLKRILLPFFFEKVILLYMVNFPQLSQTSDVFQGESGVTACPIIFARGMLFPMIR